MRKPLLSLVAVALATAACSGSASGLRPSDAVHGFLDLLDRLARIER